MDKNFLITKLVELIKESKGDDGRNHYILERIKENIKLIHSDKIYLERVLEIKISEVTSAIKKPYHEIPKKDMSVFLNPDLIKCTTCDKKIKLDEKSLRHRNFWYHESCYKANSKHSERKTKSIDYKKIKPKKDPVMFILVGLIFVFLIGSVYFILGPISMIAMGLGGGLTVYHMLGATGKLYSRNKPGTKGPSVFLMFLLGSPFIIGAMIAYEGYSLLESPTRIILLWAMTISFWSTMLFVPMAALSKYKEDIQPDVKSYPKVSVIIPAYNEEKVIANTIEALLETKYPKKEIIFVDDGSKDNTLRIATRYKDQIKILHKENGGKATALNYGIQYTTGEIIVIVDADTIIGRHSLKEIVKGFEVNEHVAAVAGNIKVRNVTNWITKCQALEYITGIQIVRRAFDVFGSITIVPGALGAFKKSYLLEAGAYGKDTIVEEFDQTIK